LKDGWKSYEPENDKSFCYFTKIWELLWRDWRLRMNGTGFMLQWLVWNTHIWGATWEATFERSILVSSTSK
jgi:hypothetical protein